MGMIVDYDIFFLPADNLETAKISIKNAWTGNKVRDRGMTTFKVGDNEPAIILSNMPQVRPAVWVKADSVLWNNRLPEDAGR